MNSENGQIILITNNVIYSGARWKRIRIWLLVRSMQRTSLSDGEIYTERLIMLITNKRPWSP